MEEKGSKEEILVLKNLSKSFGGINAVEQFNLTMEQGELHCLIGPNGAGKTTVFKMIMGILAPSSGKILLNGEDITKKQPKDRARGGISIKMQVPGLFPDLSLKENIRVAAQNFVPKKELNTEIARLIELVHLQDVSVKNPLVKNMTHGQQQWLEIAMALAAHPKLLLLDEPAAGLGPEETEFTAELIEQLNHDGLAVLFIEHDMNFVKRIAKNVTVLHYGKKFAEGTMEEIEKNEDVIKIYLGK